MKQRPFEQVNQQRYLELIFSGYELVSKRIGLKEDRVIYTLRNEDAQITCEEAIPKALQSRVRDFDIIDGIVVFRCGSFSVSNPVDSKATILIYDKI